jgi:uncharacterized protein YlxP (DUF503 family)
MSYALVVARTESLVAEEAVSLTIGSCTIQLSIPSAHSLKDKRRVVRSAIARIRDKFNVSIAEIGGNDQWQTATLGVACVSNGQERVHKILTAVVGYLEHTRLDAYLIDYEIEIL